MGVLDSIGNTPLVKLETLNANPRVTVFAKLEGNNPGGSVKDRIAFYMIRGAEETGRIRKGDTILEATSGNTGIGLAMAGAALGYKVVLVMPECVSLERRKILEAFGAELILSPGNRAPTERSSSPGRYWRTLRTGISCRISSITPPTSGPTTRQRERKSSTR